MDLEKTIRKKQHGGVREGAGRKPFVPTMAERKQVESMARYGVPYEQIAAVVRDGIHVDTLRKYFTRELVSGKADANERVGRTMYEKAIDGDTTAMIWWTKAQMGWSEKAHIDHTSSDGSMSPKPMLDVSKLSQAARKEILDAAGQADA